jgi:hypothetical protein
VTYSRIALSDDDCLASETLPIGGGGIDACPTILRYIQIYKLKMDIGINKSEKNNTR